jgi:hypothetical protein
LFCPALGLAYHIPLCDNAKDIFAANSPVLLMEAVPAPFWFVQFFKIVGFVLHMIPMGIWFAGLPIVILCALKNGERSRFFARRISAQLPVMMALGINFGIVPLLFLQTTYYKAFYTATILTAWYWIAVIPILIVGYYALYIAAYSGERRSQMILSSILASLCLICIGILNTNGLTLMVRSDLWGTLMTPTSFHGAVLGTANNFQDSMLWMRLATMFGLGLITAGVWVTFDSHFLLRTDATGVPAKYRQWTVTLALVLTFLGAAILTWTEWKLKTNGGNFCNFYPYFGYVVLAAYLTFVALLVAKSGSAMWVSTAAVLQFLTLAGFGVIRQIGQNTGVATFVDVSKLPEAVQWDTLIAFLVCFLLGVGVIVWMVAQCVRTRKSGEGTAQ